MAENTNFYDFERGDKVKHPKWGLGTILYKYGSGEQSKVIALFQDVGQKTLAVKFAKLEKVASAPTKGKDKLLLDDIILPEVELPEVAVPVVEEEEEVLGEEEEEEEEEL